MGKEILMTQEGYDNLKEKYEDLVKVRRLEVAERLKIAREFGDLSENAEYDAAKDEQAMVEAEIKSIEDRLANAKIIEEPGVGNVVALGCTVKLHDLTWDEKLEYTIVGSTEADIKLNKISNESPIAAAILGRKKGETVEVKTPNGKIVEIKILSIKK